MGQVRDFLLDDDGNLAVVNGDFATISDADAVLQGIKIRLRLFAGEYWLDEAEGVPWIDQILVKNPDPLVVRELLRQAIAATPDVLEVTSTALEIDDATRAASISFAVTTIYSPDPVTGEVTI